MPLDLETLLGSLANEPNRERIKRALRRASGDARARMLNNGDLASCHRLSASLDGSPLTRGGHRLARKLAARALADHQAAAADLVRVKALEHALRGKPRPGDWTPEELQKIGAFEAAWDQRGSHLEWADAIYFVDYALFSGQLRRFVADEIEVWLRQRPDDIVYRSLHAIVLFREKHAALEDAGAMLNAFMEYRDGVVSVPFQSLMNYRPSLVALSGLFRNRRVASGEDLLAKVGALDWIPRDWAEWFPAVDLARALRTICSFFVIDCPPAQEPAAVQAYNKIKHGALVGFAASRYNTTQPPYPVILYQSGVEPLTTYAVNPADDALGRHHKLLWFVQIALRLLAGLYVSHRYPTAIPPARVLFVESLEFEDIRRALLQMMEQPESG